jgi:hypothetical protein
LPGPIADPSLPRTGGQTTDAEPLDKENKEESICSSNLVADVAADATPNGVICAHMPAVGFYPSDAEVASARGGLPHRERPLGLTAPLPSGIRMRHRPGVGGVNGLGKDIAVLTCRWRAMQRQAGWSVGRCGE